MSDKVQYQATIEYWIRRTPMIVRDTCEVYSVNLKGKQAYIALSDQFLKDGQLAKNIHLMLDRVKDFAMAWGNDQEEAVKNLRDQLSTGGKF